MTKLMLGICGPIGAGKSTIAKSVVDHARAYGLNSEIISFAKPIKRMMNALLCDAGIEPYEAVRLTGTQEGKVEPLDVLLGYTTRHAQQWLGTEWGRNMFGPDFWTNIAMTKARNSDADLIVIDDLRFPSELMGIISEGGMGIGLERDGVAYDTSHPSEQRLHVVYLENNGEPYQVAETMLKLLLDKQT